MPHSFSVEDMDHAIAHTRSLDRTLPGKDIAGFIRHKVEDWLTKEEESKEEVLAPLEPPCLSDPEHVEDEVPTLVESPPIVDLKGPRTLEKKPSLQAFPTFPRPFPLKRQDSERRDRLYLNEPDAEERRACSVGRRAEESYFQGLSPPRFPIQPSHSVPELRDSERPGDVFDDNQTLEKKDHDERPGLAEEIAESTPMPPAPASVTSAFEELDRLAMQTEMDTSWILNLSMRFKDHSDREKFFITYAQEPNKWRRVTISCDYRNITPDSLEADLKSLHYQRDKSARIYESIRDSLPDIQFYPTVTNLKLQTQDGRLHVHVTEDLNEIIPYPPVSTLRHIPCPRFKETYVLYDAHMSGFVYKISLSGRTLIKKEIPGPEAVDEFLYEVNALSTLQNSPNIVQFEGLVVDETDSFIKGLLLSFASKGALVDVIYDYKFSDALPWSRRERWARQIICGLSDLHESGFVQGDFTLSNIVIDAEDDARIIDINRRGCPVGWEPPELEDLIHSGQRISMFIGPKTDLFQLGMVLWALAMQVDEPEREEHPLRPISTQEVPNFYREIVETCLKPNPKDRKSAKELLNIFPENKRRVSLETLPVVECDLIDLSLPHRPQKEYIDPDTAVHLEDIRPIPKESQLRPISLASELSSGATFADGTASSDYVFNSCHSCLADHPARDASPVTQSESDVSIKFEDCGELQGDDTHKSWGTAHIGNVVDSSELLSSPTETVRQSSTFRTDMSTIPDVQSTLGTILDPNLSTVMFSSNAEDEYGEEFDTPRPPSKLASPLEIPSLINNVEKLQLNAPTHTDSGFDEPSSTVVDVSPSSPFTTSAQIQPGG